MNFCHDVGVFRNVKNDLQFLQWIVITVRNNCKYGTHSNFNAVNHELLIQVHAMAKINILVWGR